MRFRYRVLDEHGKILKGSVWAKNKEEAAQRVKGKSFSLIALTHDVWGSFSTVNALKIQEKAHFCFCLQQLLSSGVPIREALLDLAESEDSSPQLQEIFSFILVSVEGGKSFSQALKNLPEHFSTVFVATVEAGELSGNLPEVLEKLYESFIWQENLRQKRQRLLLYPAIVSLVVSGVFVFLMLFLIPQLKRFVLAMHFQLPWYSAFLFQLADFFQNHWLILLLSLIFLIFSAVLLNKKRPFFCATLLLKLPVVGNLIQKMALARFAQTLALLYSSGIPILNALEVAQNVLGNAVLKKESALARFKINQGESLANAFRQSAFFPPLLVRMLAVGEKTGELDRALNHVKNFYAQEVHNATERLNTLIEPVLTLILGALLAWVVLAVLEPIYQILGEVL